MLLFFSLQKNGAGLNRKTCRADGKPVIHIKYKKSNLINFHIKKDKDTDNSSFLYAYRWGKIKYLPANKNNRLNGNLSKGIYIQK